MLYAARYGTVSSGAGIGLELQAIGAAVIGGVAISGGVGTVWGAAIGAYLLLTINRALPILGIDDFWQRAVVGVADHRRDRARPRARAPTIIESSLKQREEDTMTATASETRTPRTYRTHAQPAWRRMLLTRETAVIALLVIVIAVALAVVPNFDSPLTVTYLLRDVAPILLIALPMTLIIITEEIDLSVASIVGTHRA